MPLFAKPNLIYPPLSTWAWREIKSWLYYNGIFCKFQENSFDIFLPYIAYYHNWLNRPPIFRSITILYTTLYIGSRQFTGSLEVCYNANDITNCYPIAAALQNVKTGLTASGPYIHQEKCTAQFFIYFRLSVPDRFLNHDGAACRKDILRSRRL